MTQEDKQLLLIDLCARLPYGVIIHNEEGYEGHLNSISQNIFGIELGVNVTAMHRVDFQLDTCKPYLRPMSSMTEEEENEYRAINCYEGLFPRNEDALDYILSHHFDHRGLIEKGLALEAPEGMYKMQ